MSPIDKKFEKEVKEGKIPKPIEDLPSEWAKEDREIEGGKPDLNEAARAADASRGLSSAAVG
jgi:hypothetical protein